MIIRIRDYTELLPTISDETRDFFSNAANLTSRPLSVTVAATHSGRRTRNNTFYLPHRMKNSTHTWVSEFPKPFLTHHEKHDDPIGRAIGADYIDTSGVGNISDATDNKLIPFVRGTLSIEDTANYCHVLMRDQNLVENGLGYISLRGAIISPDAKEKILDGRYITGSTGATSDSAICSICHTDWATGEFCEHTPGKEYEDGKICVLIPGDFVYEEYSFVNNPADTLSRIIRIGDAVIEQTGDVHFLKSVILFDSIEESKMKLTREQILSIIGTDIYPKYAEELADKILEKITDESTEEDVKKLLSGLMDSVRVFWGSEYEDIVGDDKWGREYAEMMYGLVEDATDSDREIVVKMVRDAKLSAGDRKKLKSSTFCGPDKSFPVPDCAHVIAARRLVGKYKGPGNKESILACVNRKAKRMGCDKTEDTFEEFDAAFFDKLEDEQLTQLHDSIHEAFIEREMEITDSADEIKLLQDNLNSANARIAEEVDKNKKLIVNRIIDLRILSGEKIVDINKMTSEMLSLSDSDIQLQAEKFAQFDISTVSEKLSLVDKIDDPTLHTNTQSQMSDEEKKKLQNWIIQKYIEIRFRSQALADNFVREMEKKGWLSTDTRNQIGVK